MDDLIFQKLSNSLIPSVEDTQLVSRLVKVSSCFLSICGGEAIRLWPAWELAEDPLPRLALFFYASKRCSSRSDHLLARTQTALLGLARSPLSLLKSGSPSLESSPSPLLEGSTFSDIRAPRPMKQSAAPPVQERPAPVSSLVFL
jgi:hypothetical protein